MKKYSEYKNSGIDWVGKIPAHWEIVRIKDYTYVKARIGWQGLRSDEFIEDSNWYCITGTDFFNGIIDWNKCYCVSEDRYNQDKKIQLNVGDLLITKDGSIGKIAIIKSLPKKATLNSGVFVTRPKYKKYSNLFMFWLLNSNIFFDFIDITKNGSTILHLYQNVFERFHFCIPSELEQMTITNYLDVKTREIDKKINLLIQKIIYYQELRKSLINKTVCQGLNKNTNLRDSGVDWIGKIPEHWDVKRGKSLFVEISRKGYPHLPLLAASQKMGVVLKSMLETRSMEAQKDFENFKLVNIGDFVISLRSFEGGIETAYYKGIISPAYSIFIFRNENIVDYYKYLFKSASFINFLQSRISGIRDGQSIKYKEIEACYFPTLPIEEQISISKYLDEKVQVIDEIVNNIHQQIETLKELRKTLINDVVTGKIKVIE